MAWAVLPSEEVHLRLTLNRIGSRLRPPDCQHYQGNNQEDFPQVEPHCQQASDRRHPWLLQAPERSAAPILCVLTREMRRACEFQPRGRVSDVGRESTGPDLRQMPATVRGADPGRMLSPGGWSASRTRIVRQPDCRTGRSASPSPGALHLGPSTATAGAATASAIKPVGVTVRLLVRATQASSLDLRHRRSVDVAGRPGPRTQRCAQEWRSGQFAQACPKDTPLGWSLHEVRAARRGCLGSPVVGWRHRQPLLFVRAHEECRIRV